MSEENKQAVVEKPDAQAKPAAEGADARDDKGDDLDALLSQYDTETQQKPGADAASKPEQKQATDSDPVKKLATEVEELRRREADRQYRSDIQPVLQKLRGDIPPELYDDEDIQDWLDREAKKDTRIAKAWQNRHDDPRTLDKVVDALGKRLSQRFSKLPDKQATDDRDAVAAAIRGASTKAPEGKAPDYSKASNQEFANQVEKDFGFRPI